MTPVITRGTHRHRSSVILTEQVKTIHWSTGGDANDLFLREVLA